MRVVVVFFVFFHTSYRGHGAFSDVSQIILSLLYIFFGFLDVWLTRAVNHKEVYEVTGQKGQTLVGIDNIKVWRYESSPKLIKLFMNIHEGSQAITTSQQRKSKNKILQTLLKFDIVVCVIIIYNFSSNLAKETRETSLNVSPERATMIAKTAIYKTPQGGSNKNSKTLKSKAKTSP